MDWLDMNVILNGHRNGKVKLWDARTKGLEGTSSRVQHPSSIAHVRRITDHRIAVAGLENELCLYDMRFLPREVPVIGGPTRPWLTVPSYQNKDLSGLAVGFDVCGSLIAAGTDRNTVQLFDTDRGVELPQIHSRSTLGERPPCLAQCLRFVDGEGTREAPRLFVAVGNVIDEWSW